MIKKKTTFGPVIHILLAFLTLYSKAEEEVAKQLVSIDTSLGSITGVHQQFYNEFLGIPFAEPPIGALRFLPPKPVQRYENYQATSQPSECLQAGMNFEETRDPSGSEDCLYLNVYVPTSKSSEPKTVMFWIYGGGFITGSNDIYIPLNFLREEVIVVLPNYRLGALGFTTFGNDVVSGNMGLRDQIEALKWVQRHIASFGGDPSKVTIFGESAGGMSVSALYTSPLASGLFSAAIAQSGSMLLFKDDTATNKPWRVAQELAKEFKCASTDLGPEMLKCLQDVPAKEFFEGTVPSRDPAHKKYDTRGMHYFPVADYYSSDPVLPYGSVEAFLDGHFNAVPFMTGTIKYDGAIFIDKLGMYGPFEASVKNGPVNLYFAASSNRSEISAEERREFDILHQFYAQGTTNVSINTDGLCDMFTDVFFQNPDQRSAQLVSKRADVYNYYYTYKGSNSLSVLFSLPEYDPMHADELMIQFAMDQAPKFLTLFPEGITLSEEDKKMSDVMTKYWTQFAKYGNPSPDGMEAHGLPKWNKFGEEKNYLELKPEPEMKKDLNPTGNLLIQRIINDPREANVMKKNSKKGHIRSKTEL